MEAPERIYVLNEDVGNFITTEVEAEPAEWFVPYIRADLHEAKVDDDSIIASCNCVTKTPAIEHHKKGCKYRLICERDALQAENQRLRSALAILSW